MHAPVLKGLLTELPGTRALYPTWERRHPFDVEYGIDTSGFLSVESIHSDPAVSALIMPYCGSQPSIVRKALTALGDVEDYAFADLGCGKGRATVVASEFGFRHVIGVELSPVLAAIARNNASLVGRKFPSRPRIQIVESNVLNFAFPQGKLVIFMYHPFKSEILFAIIKELESLLRFRLKHLLVVYYNPVHFDLFNESPAFRRFFDASLPYEAAELG